MIYSLFEIPNSIINFCDTIQPSLAQKCFWLTSQSDKLRSQNRKARQIQPFFAYHEGKVLSVGEDLFSHVTNPKDDPSLFPSRLHRSKSQRSNRVDFIVIRAVQSFESCKSIPYSYAIPHLEHHPTQLSASTWAGYSVGKIQAMPLDPMPHSPSQSQFCTNWTLVWQGNQRKRGKIWVDSGENCKCVLVKSFSIDAYGKKDILHFIS